MFSINKNSYLHNYFENMNPRLINRCVDKAREFSNIDEHDLDPPANRLTSEQPNIPVKNVDVTRRSLGFGRKAMPKLRRELHNKDQDVVIAAIETICDLVHDPERGYEAVNLKIIDRMVNLMSHESEVIRERTSRTLAVLAELAAGREAIVTNKSLLANIAACAEDTWAEIRIQVAALLEMIARFWKAADDLVQFGFIQILLSNLLTEDSEIQIMHLETLRSLMYETTGKIIAIESDGFNIFRPEVYTNAASVIMFCTLKTQGKLDAYKVKNLPKRLIHLSRNKLNPSTQIFAIKALSNICEHPKIRTEVQRKYFEQIKNIQVGDDPCIKSYKNQLLTVIGWVASSST
ncbi:radial spoke head 14 homolog isoform X3 [Leptinotarsa decemlineata]|uniref:radial spoke head 14 homolog isoform X3 n=1 Tax=Leptinotarsa decemlineata TaxID=7539 RepID=UPI003D30948A